MMTGWPKILLAGISIISKLIILIPFIAIGFVLSLIASGLVAGHKLHGLWDDGVDKLLD